MLVLVLVLASVLSGQQAKPSTAELSGKVVDRSGTGLPGVIVSLLAAPPTTNRTVITDGEGGYRISRVEPATYNVSFELAGFESYSRARLALEAGQARTLQVALEAAPPENPKPPAPRPDPTFDLAPGEVGVGIETSKGTFYIAVDTEHAPITAANFLKYVDGGFYTRGRFHRATRPDNYAVSLPNRPMMNIIQGGINPARRSEGFPAIPLERTSVTGLKHVTGTVSMARGAPDTATSDFFVLLDDQASLDFGGLRFDDGQGGAAFGHVLSGLDVVRAIQQQPVDGQNLSGPVAIFRVWRLEARNTPPRDLAARRK